MKELKKILKVIHYLDTENFGRIQSTTLTLTDKRNCDNSSGK
jgi:hypothetical protein